MLINEVKKGIKCFVQGYGEYPGTASNSYFESYGVISEDPLPGSNLVSVTLYGKYIREVKTLAANIYWIDQNTKIPGYTEEKKSRQVMLELPEAIKKDYLNDKFEEFFNRVIADIDNSGCCGNYEKEIAKELLQSFKNSREL